MSKFNYSRDDIIQMYDRNEFLYFPVIIKNKDGKKDSYPQCKWKQITKSPSIPRGSGIALITGEKNNISVLDFDSQDAVDTWKDMCGVLDEDPDKYPFTVKSGNGWHIYFRWDGEVNGTKIIKINGKKIKLDIRGEGGYIYAPSTFHPVKEVEYKLLCSEIDMMALRPLPKWFKDRMYKNLDDDYNIIEVETFKKNIPLKTTEKIMSPIDKEKQVIDKCNLLNNTLSDYDDWLKLGMSLHNLEQRGDITNGLEIWDNVSAKDKSYDPGCCEKKWDTFSDNKEKKLGWTYINEKCKEDNPDKYYELLETILPQIQEEEFKSWTPKVCHINKYKNAFMSAETHNEALEISREFNKHFILCSQGMNMELFIYVNDDIGKNKYWNIQDFNYVKKNFYQYKRKFGEEKEIYLLNEMYTIQVDETRIDASKDLLYETKNGLKIFNRYERPKYKLDYVINYIDSERYSKHMRYNFDYQKTMESIELHLFNLCNKNKNDVLWMKNWISSVFLIPNFKPLCWPIWVGSPGTGKTSYINKIFKEFMGNAYTIKDDGKFAGNGCLSTLIGKTFGLGDEMRVSTKEDYNKLKTLVSENTILFEEKYKNPRMVGNIINMIFTSNHGKPISNVLPNERRFCYFQADPKIANDDNYFQFLDQPWQLFVYYFIRDYFDENEIDVDKVKELKRFKFANYKTEINKINVRCSLNPISKFVKHFIRKYFDENVDDEKLFIKPKDLYQDYKEWFNEKPYDSKPQSSAVFTQELIKNGYCDKIRKRVGGDINPCYYLEIQSKKDLIEIFKRNHSGLDPLD